MIYEDVKDDKKIKLKTVKFFGTGFSDDDYQYLQDQYTDWTTRCECKTKAQEEVFKRICFKQLEILKANRLGVDTKYLDKTFQDYLDTANLKPKQNNLDTLSDAQTFGTLLAKWENERPLPEIDEELKDVDKIGLYWVKRKKTSLPKRHVQKESVLTHWRECQTTSSHRQKNTSTL